MTPTDPRTTPNPRTTPDPGTDAALRSLLAGTPLREPAPERVRLWQAALRELPPPTAAGHRPVGAATDARPDSARSGEPTFNVRRPEETGQIPHRSDAIPGGLTAATEGPRVAAGSLRAATEGPAVDGGPSSAGRPDTPVGGSSAPTGGSLAPARAPRSNTLRLITRGDRSTPLSSDRSAPQSGVDEPANIRTAVATQPAAMATRPLTMADAGLAVAKIHRSTPRSGLAAATVGLAAAITAAAVLLPSASIRPPAASIRPPAAATADHPTEGPAATTAGWPTGLLPTWPSGPVVDRPATRSTEDAEPLTLTRGQLLALPPPVLPPPVLPLLPVPRLANPPVAAQPPAGPLRAAPPPATPPAATPPAAVPPAAVPPAATPPAAVPPSGHPLTIRPSERDLGPLAAPATLDACLARFGARAQPIAARRVVLDGRAGVLLVFPTERPGRLRLLVVDPRCSAALTDDTVGR